MAHALIGYGQVSQKLVVKFHDATWIRCFLESLWNV
jgi:hypothetical protein